MTRKSSRTAAVAMLLAVGLPGAILLLLPDLRSALRTGLDILTTADVEAAVAGLTPLHSRGSTSVTRARGSLRWICAAASTPLVPAPTIRMWGPGRSGPVPEEEDRSGPG